MSLPFLYFIPVGSDDRSAIEYAFDGPHLPQENRVTGAGPGDGRSGKLYGNAAQWTTPYGITNFRLDLKLQEWRNLPNVDAYVGWYTDDDRYPTVEELKRARTIPGVDVSGWHVPISRTWNEQGQYIIELPRYVDVDDTGSPIAGDVLGWCQSTWELSEEIFAKICAESGGEDGTNVTPNDFTVEDTIRYAWQILAVNYRVSSVELAVLKSLVIGDCMKYIDAFLDLQSLNELLKKTHLDDFSTTDGQEVATQPTALAS